MANSALQHLAELPQHEQDAWLETLSPEELLKLPANWDFHARPEQKLPANDDVEGRFWKHWLILAGRGFGKTRAGAEAVREWVETEAFGPNGRIALVGATTADVRDLMVEGVSGILSVFPEGEKPDYQPSKRRIVFKNGYMAYCYSAEEPDRLRGPQFHGAWCDELAAWKYCQDTWDMLAFGLRLGEAPKTVITTTPRPIPLVRELIAKKNCHVTRGSTYDNKANLAPDFLEELEDKYEGTRLGRQELHAEILDDVPGALWKRVNLDKTRVKEHPALVRVVIAVDPSVSATKKSDECGIVVVGCGYVPGDKRLHGYVLEDLSGKMSTDEWSKAAVKAYHDWGADRIVAEVNNGGDLVETSIKNVEDPTGLGLGGSEVPYKAVRATRGKYIRAEPVSALYEQERMHHVGAFAKMEDQMCLFTPDLEFLKKSPDRADATIWGFTDLMLGKKPHRPFKMNLDVGSRTSPWKGN
jgi:phage terminase large subunit-like protein